MDTTPSTTVNQDVLLYQMEALGVESTTSFITSKADTPLPKENISNETLQLFDNAATNSQSQVEESREKILLHEFPPVCTRLDT